MKSIIEKLRNNNGESMAELLIALLIGSLAMIMLADMVMVSSKILVSNKENYKDYIEHLNVLSERNTSSPTEIGEVIIRNGEVDVEDNDVAMFVYTKRDTVIVSYRKR